MLGVRNTAGALGSMLGPGLVMLLAPVLSARTGFLMATAIMALLVLVAGLGWKEVNSAVPMTIIRRGG